ncbi:triphosphoribosyl-dephospho-CoA synthase [Legionella micdadei]|uniref:triphosphoribosyl-dephospho-CoA synthase n=1 Tax=Legionella micdadei TaxID=451 RepID=A0A098GCK5_LEGMI|nr:triphosphoribosyl-dephospho-CoA synthase [Legionella micdadei]ARG98129.1 triphosphoribosyl-dephospho-CoA synthase [Legionella micdadei]ARH00927.1 triphosphoribosyl-dephospho-CoA synthase [Legionella micdadei]KTD30027.1 2-(5''-triphosphoribosyl)-3'-dephosphocoenzyme-A synthase [Legionella micdadei]NSL18594.1 triphosphoribosyl-dephospho-CoA synthase [Legionella micdadei]CEG60219.1 2(5-triphosphoribosyl)-3-dephosphocoenzyme A synthase CitG, modifier of citrate lyase [Legionella micdadei]
MKVIPPYVANHSIAKFLAKVAVRALYFEAKAYPKPGLVSFIDSGAHQDLNGEILFRSLFTLRHYFYQIANQGLERKSLEILAHTAFNAEQRVLEKTKGITTHGDVIFSLGFICISAARLTQENLSFTPANLHHQLLNDRQSVLDDLNTSAFARKAFEDIDAKQVTINEYEMIFQLLPALIALYKETKSIDAICLFAYLELLIRIDDSNVLFHKGKVAMDYARKIASEILAIDCIETRFVQAQEAHYSFSQKGISPREIANLIVILLFLGQLFCEQLLCH